MKLNRIIHTALILFFTLSLNPIIAQRAQIYKPFSEEMFVVSNYSSHDNKLEKESLNISQLLDYGVRGYYFDFELDSLTIRARIPSDTIIDAYDLLKPIADMVNTDSEEFVILFFEYSFASVHITSLLKQLGIYHKLWIEDRPGQWPGPEQMIQNGKQVILYTLGDAEIKSSGFHHLWDYAVEPYHATDILPRYTGGYKNGEAKNPFLFFRGYNLPEDTVGLDLPFQNFHVNENPFLVANLIDLWKLSGKKPNFLFVNRYSNQADAIVSNVLAHKYVRGLVSHNGMPVGNVNWEGSVQTSTSGYFSFPFIPGEEVNLKLNKPGYILKPSVIQLDEIENNIIQNVIANPIKINGGLQAFYPFTDNMKDLSLHSRHGEIEGVSFTNDIERGKVLHLKDSQSVVLPSAMEMELYNHSFTVSAWVKIDTFPQNDLTVLGTSDASYRKGLHLQFRNKRPYFGFFANDLMGNEVILEDRWYHVVWRYTKSNGEQAIFVNGLADNQSSGHPSFMGRTNLIIGKSIHQNNFYNGKIDDLAIWNRPLGNEEIWNLYQDVYDLSEFGFRDRFNYHWKIYVLLGVISIILLLIVILRQIGKKKKRIGLVFEAAKQEENSIRLFGGFLVIDKQANDISSLFTAKVKLLFILIILNSYKSKKGISSEAINQIIWPEHDRKRAANNRRVTINKLRQLLMQLEGVELINEVDHWKISINERAFFDYGQCMEMIKKEDFSHNPERFSSFYSLVQRGSLLPEIEEEWLDKFKGAIASEIIDNIMRFINSSWDSCPPDQIVKLCDRIFEADPLHEEALSVKVKVLKKMGQSNKANFTLNEFSKLYEESLGTKYKPS